MTLPIILFTLVAVVGLIGRCFAETYFEDEEMAEAFWTLEMGYLFITIMMLVL